MSERDDDEDFASMLEASYEAATYSEGQMVEGRVVAVGRDVAFIDVGGKGEATIDLEELVDDEGKLDVQAGDVVQGVVVSTAGGLKLSHRLARRAASSQELATAFRTGLPVEGRVEQAIRGGFEVRIGSHRGFCPISQIDTSFTEDPSVHVSRVYTFRILEHDERTRRLVVSRRALLEEEQRARAAEVRRTIVPGAVLTGRVTSVRDFGAFVDLGAGVQGLLHVSEMSWSRVRQPESVVRPGDEITVSVLRIDEGKGTIALGLKQLQEDPWSRAGDTYEVGLLLQGTVSRLAEFGAFIELEPGIEALAHASTFPPSGKRDAWKALVPPGAKVAVEIVSFEPERRRIGVTVLDEAALEARGPRVVAPEGEGDRGFGSLADKLRDAMRGHGES
jgi:small subunit ribosomal protein S1